MNAKYHILSIIMEDRESAFHPVNELLHSYAQNILLRVGYPMRDLGVAVIFLISKGSFEEHPTSPMHRTKAQNIVNSFFIEQPTF